MRSNRIRRWLRRRDVFTGRITEVAFYGEKDDLPDVPKASELAVAGSLENPKWALLDCPCGNGHTVLLPLQRSSPQHWSLTVDPRGSPTLSPSIDREAERRCHYWLRDGRITWV